MSKFTFKMLLRSIKASLGRFLAILAIIALGVGLFAGLKSSQPAMQSTVNDYMHDNRMYDFQLLSSLGLTESDRAAFSQLDGVEYAEGAYFADAMASIGKTDEPYKFMSITENVSVPLLVAGRMPKNGGECLADAGAFSEKDIGKTLTLDEDNDEDTLKMFTERSFRIVGIAKTPRYISNDRGSTSLGSGSIKGFVLLPASAFDSEAYHEILLSCGFDGELSSDEYNAERDRLKPRIQQLLNRCGVRRYDALRADADKELEEAQQEINDGWSEYYANEAAALGQINEGLAQIEAAEAEIAKNRAELDNAEKQLEDGLASIPQARQEIADNRALLDEKQKEIDAGRAQLAPAEAQIAQQEAELASARRKLNAAKELATAPYRAAVNRIQGEINSTQAAIDALDQSVIGWQITLQVLQSRLERLQGELATAQQNLANAEAQFADQEAQLAEGEAQLAAAKAQIADAKAELDAGQQQIDSARAELDNAEKQLDDAENNADENRRQIAEARAQLEAGAEEVAANRAQLEAARNTALNQLAGGRQQLEDAQAELDKARADTDEQLKLDLYVLTRDENSGCATFKNDVTIVSAVGDAFPVFFALIAALVCVTTMTRMINEERTQIGTLKAMGYSSGAIMSKYLWYSGSSALIGCVLGFALGVTAIPYIVWRAYEIIYSYTQLQFYFSTLTYFGSLGVSVLGTLFVTWLACRKELAGKPAELIRPKAPNGGKRILLEYIRPLWSKLSFLDKVTLRNAFRYKQRVWMMLLGIGGCTALLITGFGIKDSIGDVLDYQYGEVMMYDVVVNYDPARISADKLSGILEQKSDGYSLCYQEEVRISGGSGSHDAKLVEMTERDMKGMIDLHYNGQKLAYPKAGEAIISEGLAEQLELKIGDKLTLETDKGNISVKISGICKNYLNHYVYVAPETIGSPAYNAALLQTDASDKGESLAAYLRAQTGVSYVSVVQQERDIMADSMASLDIVVALIVVCSAALAFITLYNLTNINIMERSREIATLKVLGFYPGETASYVLRENLMLSVLGTAVGLLLGKFLHRFVMAIIQVDYMHYDVRIGVWSYVLGFVITVLFALAASLMMRPKLDRINMAESLKSVE